MVRNSRSVQFLIARLRSLFRLLTDLPFAPAAFMLVSIHNPALVAHHASLLAFSPVMADIITSFDNSITAIGTEVNKVAPLLIVCGLVGIGIMYAMSSSPILSDWNAQHPKALNKGIIGVIIVVIAPTVASMIVFPPGT